MYLLYTAVVHSNSNKAQSSWKQKKIDVMRRKYRGSEKASRGLSLVGSCPAVVAQCQSTGGSNQRCPEFDSG